jgi:perosamine synthetase
MTRFRHVAPAGAPIGLADLFGSARLRLTSADVSADLQTALRARVGASQFHFVSTGRAAMTVILQALRGERSADRDEVIVPSYTCYSVAASVVKAGLKPRIVDIDPETLDYDPARLERVDARRVLAIVATNLYGIPNDMPRLDAFARLHDIFLVDDAAQALGARIAGRSSGTWGDAGLYSFDKGKNVSAIDGGVIVCRDARVGRAVGDLVANLPRPSFRTGVTKAVKLAAYVALLNPRMYWIPNGIPQLQLGTTAYTTDYPVEHLGRAWLALASTMVGHLDEFTMQRRKNGTHLLRSVATCSGLRAFRAPNDATPVYPRLPLFANDRERRDSLLRSLVAAGIGATASYPSALVDVPELRGLLVGDVSDASGGRSVAARILTLPTHPQVSAADLSRMDSVIAAVLARSRPAGLNAA